METVFEKIDRADPFCEAVKKAASIIRAGGLVAFPTETVYGLGGNALNPEASSKIYAAKGRPSDNPLIAHIAETEELEAVARDIPDAAYLLAEKFWPGPLTMVLKKNASVPKTTTGGLDTVAVRMPSDEIARALIRESGVPIAAPSANTSGRPSPTTAEHVREDLSGKIEMILDGGPVEIGLESTIIDLSGDVPMLLRPGAVTLEMLRSVLGTVAIDPAILGPVSADVKPKAPGMKYRHYAPKAQMTIVMGEQKAVEAKINELAAAAVSEGKLAGIIATDESMGNYTCGMIKSIGKRSSEDTVAHNLFAVLRDFDEAGVDCIFSEGFEEEGIGRAIMNRMRKAAGYNIISVK